MCLLHMVIEGQDVLGGEVTTRALDPMRRLHVNTRVVLFQSLKCNNTNVNKLPKRSVQLTNLLVLGDELAVGALLVDGLDVGGHGGRGPAHVGAQRAAHMHALRVLVQFHHVGRREGTQLAELNDRG